MALEPSLWVIERDLWIACVVMRLADDILMSLLKFAANCHILDKSTNVFDYCRRNLCNV